MTNEEIEKRFEFELLMGLFKLENSKLKASAIRVSKKDKSSKILFRILKNLGYKHVTKQFAKSILYNKDFLVIIISKSKEFEPWNTILDGPKLPDYAMKYSFKKRWRNKDD